MDVDDASPDGPMDPEPARPLPDFPIDDIIHRIYFGITLDGARDMIILHMTENIINKKIENKVLNKPIRGFLDYMKTTINSTIAGNEGGFGRLHVNALPPIKDTDTLSISYNGRVYNDGENIVGNRHEFRDFLEHLMRPHLGLVSILVIPGRAGKKVHKKKRKKKSRRKNKKKSHRKKKKSHRK